MPSEPAEIVFTCTSCQTDHSVKQVRRNSGQCKSCPTPSWKLTVRYVDVERRASVTGLVSLITFGVGWTKTKKYSNQWEADGLTANEAKE